MHHISADDLERYYFWLMPGPELAVVEEHLFWCQHCMDRMEAVEQFAKLVRAGLIRETWGRDAG